MDVAKLNDLVADALAQTVDPREASNLVLGKMDTDERSAAFALLLPSYIRVRNQEPRKHAPGGETERDPMPGNHASPRQGRASTKADRIRDWWAAQMDSGYFVNGTWKRLRDLTRDEVLVTARDRRDIAERNEAAALRLERLADAMAAAGAATVADLSFSTALDAWGRAA